MDGWVLGFAVVVSVITGVLFGLVPALAASRADLASVLRGSGEAQALQPSRSGILRVRSRNVLVVGQVALSIVLLIGAALLIESIYRLSRVDPGFDGSHLLTMKISPVATHYDTDAKRAVFYEQVVDRLQALPGVSSAAVALTLPTTGWSGVPVQLAGQAPMKLGERPIAVFQDITPGYFRTMKIALKRGREFSRKDRAESVPVAIISETLARTLWPGYPSGPDPIGEHILVGRSPQAVEIVGIAGDVRQSGPDTEPNRELYVPCAQEPTATAMIAVRTAGEPRSFANAVRNQILAMDRDQPISGVSTMQELLDESEGQLRLIMTLLGVFAGAATVLTVIGLYGIISYSVAQRTREIGIRRAVGAQPGDILALVVGQGLRLVLAGVVLGLGGAWGLTRVMKDLLFQVSAVDPVTFVAVAILFVAVALAASYLPARRATGIDPLAALRAG